MGNRPTGLMGECQMVSRREPPRTGQCYWGCGQATQGHFASGDDSRALWFAMKQEYGNTAAFLVAHGYGPGGKKAHRARP